MLQSITQLCKDCQQEFTISSQEQERFLELQHQDPNFKMPKRCRDCRKKRRLAKQAEGGQSAEEYHKPHNHMRFPHREHRDFDEEM